MARNSDAEKTRQYRMKRTLLTNLSELYTARLFLRLSSDGNENLMMRARGAACPDPDPLLLMPAMLKQLSVWQPQ